MRRIPLSGIALLSLWAGTCAAYRQYQSARLSPFALWTVRAGAPFEQMDALAFREMKHHFDCRPADDGVRLCAVKTDGPPGVMRVAVDGGGRAIFVQYLTGDTTPMMRDEGRRLRADWNLVRPGVTSAADDGSPATTTTRWETRDHHWSAEMRDGRSAVLPSAITLADERAFARIAERNVPALLLLARHGIVSDAALTAAERREPGSLARAADSLAAPGRALAADALALPACPAVPVAPRVSIGGSRGEDETRTALGADLEPLAQQTIALAYPGARLVASGGVLYLLDASGRWERARILPVARSEDGARFAMALGFPDRESALAERMQAHDTTGRCRAPAEILVADVDPLTQAVGGLRRVDLEREALASGVLGLEFEGQSDGSSALVASYVGSYGTAEWHAEVRWHALIAGDSLRVTRRVPDVVIRVDDKSATMQGAFERYGNGPDDRYGFADDRREVQRLAVFDGDESYPHLAAPKRIVVPRGADGLPNGWTLLAMF